MVTCRDCGLSFTCSEDERRTLTALGHHHPPSCYRGCRAVRRTRHAERGTRAVAPGYRKLRQTRTTVSCSSCVELAVVPSAARAGRSV